MASEELKSNDEAQIRQLIDNWAKALRGKDVDGLMANYAPDLVLFNLAPPLQYNGVDACRNIWEEWLPAFQGPVGYEIHDLSITAGAAVAFCHSLTRISGTRANGETDTWVRATVATARSTARGWSHMSMFRCRSTWIHPL
jgi:ketosteroid isomerase-like protein